MRPWPNPSFYSTNQRDPNDIISKQDPTAVPKRHKNTNMVLGKEKKGTTK